MSETGESSPSSGNGYWHRVRDMLSNRISEDMLEPGDHIYSWRTAYIYAHHGIYIGQGTVIHFGNAGRDIGTGTSFDLLIPSFSPFRHSGQSGCEICKDVAPNSGVMRSCLGCFLSGGDLYRFAYSASRATFHMKLRGLCTMVPSDPPAEVIGRARRLLEIGFGSYNLFRKNCEDFAIYCKTGFLVESGFGQSSQIHTIKSAVCSLVEPVLTRGLSASALLGAFEDYCEKRCKNDIGARGRRVPIEELASINDGEAT